MQERSSSNRSISIAQLHALLRFHLRPIKHVVYMRPYQLTLMDIVSDGASVDDQIELKIKSEQMYKYLDECLTDREKEIIIMRYGLNGTAPHTQREVAKLLGISRSYVSRIEKKALLAFRDRFER